MVHRTMRDPKEIRCHNYQGFGHVLTQRDCWAPSENLSHNASYVGEPGSVVDGWQPICTHYGINFGTRLALNLRIKNHGHEE